MAAIPSPRTHEQIHNYFQLINPEIPEDRLRQCLEEHNYDTQQCEESLRKVSSQYLYQHPEVSQCSTLQTADMEGRPVPAHPLSYRSYSVSAEPCSREIPDHRSVSPSLTRDGRGMPGGHARSSTWEEQPVPHHYQPPRVQENHDRTSLNVPSYVRRPVSPQPSNVTLTPMYDSGAWVLPDLPRREREEVTININQPQPQLRRSPIPPEMMQTQLLSPPVDNPPGRSGGHRSPRVCRPRRTLISEETNANGAFSPMVLPWMNQGLAPSHAVPQSRKEVHTMSSPDKGEDKSPSYKPLDPSKEDEGDDDVISGWTFVDRVNSPPKDPQFIRSISSPVSPPVVHVIKDEKFEKPNRDTQKKRSEHKRERKDFSKEREGTSQEKRNDAGTKLKEKTFLQALLHHQKTRFDLIQKRVEQTRMDVEALRKEVSDMEGELNNKRTQMPSSFPSTEAISKLRAEKQGLHIDVECLQRDISLLLARQRESQQNDSFYQNIPANNPYVAYPSPFIVPPQPVSESPEDTETSKWSCKMCTFKNHEFLTECEMCSKPRQESSHSDLSPRHS